MTIERALNQIPGTYASSVMLVAKQSTAWWRFGGPGMVVPGPPHFEAGHQPFWDANIYMSTKEQYPSH